MDTAKEHPDWLIKLTTLESPGWSQLHFILIHFFNLGDPYHVKLVKALGKIIYSSFNPLPLLTPGFSRSVRVGLRIERDYALS